MVAFSRAIARCTTDAAAAYREYDLGVNGDTMFIQAMLAPLTLEQFLERHFLQCPLARHGSDQLSVRNHGFMLLESLLAQRSVDAIAVRGVETWQGGTPGASDMRSLLASGHTIRVRHAESHSVELAEIRDDFAAAFHGRVDIHVYATPSGCKGLDWHYDAEDVFVLQTEGSKRWSLRKNTVNPWPLIETIPGDQRVERERTPVMTCELQAGDWLYIPNGYWHRTQAMSDSVSISVGVMPRTAIDVYDWLRQQLLSDLKWRQRLGTDREAEHLRPLRDVFAELGRDVAERLSTDKAVREFLNRST
jgi:50S ribosomal protein L16 3-hydroxylase